MMFHEMQYFSSWVYLLIAGVLVVLLATVALLFRLETTVGGEELTIQFGWLPVFQKRLPLRDIEHTEVCSYRPIRDFGGWGWRYGRGGVQAFTVKGDAGVCLTMRDGKRYLIGSERGEELLRVPQQKGIAG